jgi:hypothetical protein
MSKKKVVGSRQWAVGSGNENKMAFGFDTWEGSDLKFEIFEIANFKAQSSKT